MHSLLDAGLVDEIRMLVCPASRGKGTRIFENSQDLKLVEATAFENGLALLRYEIKKSDSAPAVPGTSRRRLNQGFDDHLNRKPVSGRRAG